MLESSQRDLDLDLYPPLDPNLHQTRLVTILPRDCNGRIECQLRIISLDCDPLYEALSYVWGESKKGRSILLDGREFSVTDNLFAALGRIRKREEKRTLWIDQICINQRNLAEREQQVRLMGKIFSRTYRALLWLGDIPHISPECGLQYLSSQPPFTWKDYDTESSSGWLGALSSAEAAKGRPPLTVYPHSAFPLLQELSNNAHIRHLSILGTSKSNDELYQQLIYPLSALLQQQWWTRIWTLQECILPPHGLLIVGPFSIPWGTVLKAAVNLDVHSRGCCKRTLSSLSDAQQVELRKFTSTMKKIERLRHERLANEYGTGPDKFFQYMRDFSGRNASNPRDKVFGLLGLTTEWHWRNSIKPNYNLSVAAVFEDTTVKLIESTRCLDVLPLDSQQPSNFELPSWTPDWSASEGSEDSLRLKQMSLYQSWQSPATATTAICRHEASALELTGIYLSDVEWTSAYICDSYETRSKAFSAWWEEYKAAQSWTLWKLFFASKDVEAIWFLNLLCGHTTIVDGVVELIGGNLAADLWLQSWCKAKEPDLYEKMFTTNPDRIRTRSSKVHAIDSIINNTTRMRRLFRDSYGDHSLGPITVSKGDKVYILCGGKSPVVLRPVGERDLVGMGKRKCYEFVGACYHEDEEFQCGGALACRIETKESIVLV